MTWFENKSLRVKLIVVMMFITCISALVLCGGLLAYELMTYRELMASDLGTKADILAGNINAALTFRDSSDASRVLRSLASQPNILRAAVYDEDGSLFATYAHGSGNDLSFPHSPEEAGWRITDDALILYRPVHLGASDIGMISLTSDLRLRDARLRSYIQIVSALLVGSFLIAYIVTSRLARSIANPIMSLAKTAHTITHTHDYSVRASKFGKDETGILAHALNNMLAQIEEREARERRDQDEIRKLNEELEERVRKRTSDLEVANKELEAFSYSVSHDLRAPLRHIDGFSEMLKKRVVKSGETELVRFANVISDSAKRMGQLIDELLVFSRMGRAELKLTAVDISSVVSEVVNELRYETENRDIEWILHPLPTVMADRNMLRLVLQNLVANAIKYTGKREKSRIELGSCVNESEIEFYIKDNGAGFDMQYADKLFGVFQRLHHSDEFEGIGIGLANVRRIVARHGGCTRAEGSVDRGATFYFTLPLPTKGEPG